MCKVRFDKVTNTNERSIGLLYVSPTVLRASLTWTRSDLYYFQTIPICQGNNCGLP